MKWTEARTKRKDDMVVQTMPAIVNVWWVALSLSSVSYGSTIFIINRLKTLPRSRDVQTKRIRVIEKAIVPSKLYQPVS
jgi:hypothetical protein